MTTKTKVSSWLVGGIIAVSLAWGSARAVSAPTISPGFRLPDVQLFGRKIARAKQPYPSLHQAAEVSEAIAQKFMENPYLFALTVYLDQRSGERQVFSYASPLNTLHFLNVFFWDLDRDGLAKETIDLGLSQFELMDTCLGASLPWPQGAMPQSLSRHPQLEGWKLDISEIRKIVTLHKALFLNDAPQGLITTVAWLQETDRQPACDWFVYKTANGTSQRLAGQSEKHAVVELLEIPGVPTSEADGRGCFGIRSMGNYLIIDAATGSDIELGTYIHCVADRE